MKQLFMIQMLATLTVGAFAETKVEVFGITDFQHVASPACVWINDEPVFPLLERPTFPRIANSYPIRKGDNNVRIDGLVSTIPLFETFSGPVVFYSDGVNEIKIPMVKLTPKGPFTGNFQASNDYKISGGASPAIADDEDAKICVDWVVEFLKYLEKKDPTFVENLFAKDSRLSTWFGKNQLLLSENAEFIRAASKSEIVAVKGNSVILVCCPKKLAEWKVGNTTVFLDSFMFCVCKEGIYYRGQLGDWLKIRTRSEQAASQRNEK